MMRESDVNAIADIDRLLARLEKPTEPENQKLTAEQEYWQGQAVNLAASQKMTIVIVKGGWIGPKTVADKWGYEILYTAEYVAEVAENDDRKQVASN